MELSSSPPLGALTDAELAAHLAELRREVRLLEALVSKHERSLARGARTEGRAEIRQCVAEHRERLHRLRVRLQAADTEDEHRRHARLAAVPLDDWAEPAPSDPDLATALERERADEGADDA